MRYLIANIVSFGAFTAAVNGQNVNINTNENINSNGGHGMGPGFRGGGPPGPPPPPPFGFHGGGPPGPPPPPPFGFHGPPPFAAKDIVEDESAGDCGKHEGAAVPTGVLPTGIPAGVFPTGAAEHMLSAADGMVNHALAGATGTGHFEHSVRIGTAVYGTSGTFGPTGIAKREVQGTGCGGTGVPAGVFPTGAAVHVVGTASGVPAGVFPTGVQHALGTASGIEKLVGTGTGIPAGVIPTGVQHALGTSTAVPGVFPTGHVEHAVTGTGIPAGVFPTGVQHALGTASGIEHLVGTGTDIPAGVFPTGVQHALGKATGIPAGVFPTGENKHHLPTDIFEEKAIDGTATSGSCHATGAAVHGENIIGTGTTPSVPIGTEAVLYKRGSCGSAGPAIPAGVFPTDFEHLAGTAIGHIHAVGTASGIPAGVFPTGVMHAVGTATGVNHLVGTGTGIPAGVYLTAVMHALGTATGSPYHVTGKVVHSEHIVGTGTVPSVPIGTETALHKRGSCGSAGPAIPAGVFQTDFEHLAGTATGHIHAVGTATGIPVGVFPTGIQHAVGTASGLNHLFGTGTGVPAGVFPTGVKHALGTATGGSYHATGAVVNGKNVVGTGTVLHKRGSCGSASPAIPAGVFPTDFEHLAGTATGHIHAVGTATGIPAGVFPTGVQHAVGTATGINHLVGTGTGVKHALGTATGINNLVGTGTGIPAGVFPTGAVQHAVTDTNHPTGGTITETGPPTTTTAAPTTTTAATGGCHAKRDYPIIATGTEAPAIPIYLISANSAGGTATTSTGTVAISTGALFPSGFVATGVSFSGTGAISIPADAFPTVGIPTATGGAMKALPGAPLKVTLAHSNAATVTHPAMTAIMAKREEEEMYGEEMGEKDVTDEVSAGSAMKSGAWGLVAVFAAGAALL